MGRTLDEVMDSLPTERRHAIEARAEELVAEVEGGAGIACPGRLDSGATRRCVGGNPGIAGRSARQGNHPPDRTR